MVRFKNQKGVPIELPLAAQPDWSNQVQPVDLDQRSDLMFQSAQNWKTLFHAFQKNLKSSPKGSRRISKAWVGLAYLARLQGIQEEALMPLIVHCCEGILLVH